MLQDTLAVASDGLLTTVSPFKSLSSAVRGYVLSSVITETQPLPAPKRQLGGGVVRGKTIREDLDEFRVNRITLEDEEIMAVLISATIQGLLQ
jgi:hypothetical protein